jgi:hypothetical protein
VKDRLSRLARVVDSITHILAAEERLVGDDETAETFLELRDEAREVAKGEKPEGDSTLLDTLSAARTAIDDPNALIQTREQVLGMLDREIGKRVDEAESEAWHVVDPKDSTYLEIRDETGALVATLYTSGPKRHADAKLIAAAPKLAKLARSIIKAHGDSGSVVDDSESLGWLAADAARILREIAS